MTKVFDTWISGERLNKALRMCNEQAKTQEGQKEILADASEGSTIAADYLYFRFKGLIARAFWKYFLGPDKKYWKARIHAGDDQDFASVAYEMLVGKSEVSPYNTFKTSKFDKNADLIKQFGYYFFRYLQNEAFKILRANAAYGMTGNKEKDKPIRVQSYDQEDSEGHSSESASVGDHTADIEMQDVVRRFLAKLKPMGKNYYDVFKLRLQGLSVEQVAEKIGVNKITVRNRLADLKDMYSKFVGA